MPTTEAQKRATRAYYLKNKEYCYELTKKWREDNIDLWIRQEILPTKKRFCKRSKKTFSNKYLGDFNF